MLALILVILLILALFGGFAVSKLLWLLAVLLLIGLLLSLFSGGAV